jgi:hypothetical protein
MICMIKENYWRSIVNSEGHDWQDIIRVNMKDYYIRPLRGYLSQDDGTMQ